MRFRSTLAALAAAAVLAAPVFAAGPFAQVDAGPTSIDFRPAVSGVALTLTVSGPEGFYFQEIFAAGEIASFSVFDAAGDFLPSGSYTWELRAAPELSDAERDRMAALREGGADASALRKAGKLPAELESLSGAFRVEQGAIVLGGATEETGTPDGGNRLATKDQVIADDLIVDGSVCVGMDCANGESFGFDTLRLKENNTRIKFDDTSNSSSFPNNDWQLTANDSVNGGANKFSIDDITGGRTPFTIEASAPSNSLYVDDAGNWGQGTSSPAVQIHVVDGNTPALRLQQDGSSGFTAQTWDVAGNEANFFVRDVTNGSELPFRIEPGADESSIHIDSDNDVGIGTSNPTANLHVKNGTTEVLWADETGVGIGTASPDSSLHVFDDTASFVAPLNLENQGGDVGFRLTNDLSVIDINLIESAGANELRINLGSSPQEFALTETGDLTITGSLFTGAGNTCAAGCDRVFSPDFEVPGIEEHAAFMWQNSHLPAVGPTPEQGVVNLSKTTGGMLHELEVAHIYIEQLNDELKSKQQKLAEIETANRELVQGQEELRRQMAELREQLDRLAGLAAD